MTYREGDKIVVELSEDFAGYLNAGNWFGVQRANILEHIKKTRPEPIVIFQKRYMKSAWASMASPPTVAEVLNLECRKLTLTDDGDGNKTWTEEVIK